jgi:hypothetical protein
VPATAADAAARADLARGQRAYGRALAAAEDAGTRAAALLPRYGFTRFALPPDTLILARAPESDDDEPAPGRAEGRVAYAQASQRGRVDIPSGELLDLSV